MNFTEKNIGRNYHRITQPSGVEIVNKHFKSLTKIRYNVKYLELLLIILNDISRFEFIEEVEILSLREFQHFNKSYKITDNLFPKDMKNVKKIVIFSLNADHTEYLKKNHPKNKILYELQIFDYSKYFKYFNFTI